MWDYVGVVRNDSRLNMAKENIKLIYDEGENFYKNYELTSDFIELRNLVLVARIIIESALNRKESRGLHFTSDYPELNNESIPSVISKKTLNEF